MAIHDVLIFDTTLRDGEQAPGNSLSPEEKLRLARQLDALGVDVMEAGFPAASEGDYRSVREIATELRRPVIAALARCHERDIELAGEAIRAAARGRLHVFISTSDLHIRDKLKTTREDVLALARAAIRQARAVHRRRRILGGGRQPDRPRLPLPHRRGGDPGRRDARSTCPTPWATRCPREYGDMFRDRPGPGARAPTAWC